VYVHATIGGLPRWQMREINAQNSFNGMSALDAHFGVGDATIADTVIVEFPSGVRMTRLAVPTNGRIEIVEDVATSVDITVLSTLVDDDGAHIAWWLPDWSGREVTIERAVAFGPWESWARAMVSLGGRIEIVDRDVEVGTRYGYRVHVPSAEFGARLGETWVDIPPASAGGGGGGGSGFGIALAGSNPAGGGAFGVRLSLAEGVDAHVTAYDVRGRSAAHVAIAAPEAGERVIRLGADTRLAPGVYVVRLVQGARTATCRAVVTAATGP
jgi:hypothetical protein